MRPGVRISHLAAILGKYDVATAHWILGSKIKIQPNTFNLYVKFSDEVERKYDIYRKHALNQDLQKLADAEVIIWTDDSLTDPAMIAYVADGEGKIFSST